ncbi:MAG: calcium-translocating P-type ATPase, PMCA-type [Clostridia bacterium]|nr:calcium-translocating P-type ATPase, PMCA-type [Clostridia bacterium]
MIRIEEFKGLTKEEVLSSREKHGENVLQGKKKKSFIKSFFSNLNDPIIRVLIIALIVNVLVMLPQINWFECGGILVSIVISTLVSTISEYSQENAFKKLSEEEQKRQVVVQRAEGVTEIPITELVVGDIMLLSQGDGIYADAMLLEGELSIDESALTGESTEIKKDLKSSTLFKGSLICAGTGKAIVTEVGQNTHYGKVAKELGVDTRPSPLKKRLSQLAKTISLLGYIGAVLIALAYLFNTFIIDSQFDTVQILAKIKDVKFVISHLLSALTLGISIVVVAVPEGLPMMITVVLSSNMRKMSQDNVLVRKLVGIETSGNISLLFTDKTGTLTEGKLRVKALHLPCGIECSSLNNSKISPQAKKYLTLCANYATSASITSRGIVGADATDRAVLSWAIKERKNARVISRDTFDSVKKYCSSTVAFDGVEYTLFKGAPEKILEGSSSYIDENGEEKELTTEIGIQIRKKQKELCDSAFRVVALGIKIGKSDTSLSKITFLGLVSIRDRVRKQVPMAVSEVNEAGVGVVMITGDNKDTAIAIAKECGILSPRIRRNVVLTGKELSTLDDKQLAQIIPKLAIIARALPQDKSRLVRVAQECGYVVGMTGDGINDASSLKLADVGFGMGSGTEVAKEACDIVIKDNNFASIVKAILYGRTIFESIRKFIVFQLTMNLGAVGISLIGPFIGIDHPVTITQMLWVNIIMDTLGALAFAKEPPLLEYLKMKPKDSNEKILNREMLSKILFNGIFILAISVWFLKSDGLTMLLTKADMNYVLSAFFALFIFMGIFISFVSRTDRINLLSSIGKNKSFIMIMLSISLVQISFIYFGGQVFRAIPLAPCDLVTVILLSSTTLLFDLIRKLTIKYKKVSSYKAEKQNENIKEKENV